MGFKSKAGKNRYDIRNQRLQLPIISWVSAQKRGDSWWPSLVSRDRIYYITFLVLEWFKLNYMSFERAFKTASNEILYMGFFIHFDGISKSLYDHHYLHYGGPVHFFYL